MKKIICQQDSFYNILIPELYPPLPEFMIDTRQFNVLSLKYDT